MKDFNFFEPYLVTTKKKEKKKSKPLVVAIKVIFMVSVIVAPIFVFGSIYLDQNAIKVMEEELNSPVMQAALIRVNEKHGKLATLEDLYRDLAGVDKQLSRMGIVNNNHIVAMAGAVPENVIVKDVELISGKCKINGVAFKRSSVAEFELNMRKTGLFENLLIENISGTGDEFTYTLSFSLNKEVE